MRKFDFYKVNTLNATIEDTLKKKISQTMINGKLAYQFE